MKSRKNGFFGRNETLKEAMKELRKELDIDDIINKASDEVNNWPDWLKENAQEALFPNQDQFNDYIHAFPVSHKTPEERAVSEKEKADKEGRVYRKAGKGNKGTKSD